MKFPPLPTRMRAVIERIFDAIDQRSVPRFPGIVRRDRARELQRRWQERRRADESQQPLDLETASELEES